MANSSKQDIGDDRVERSTGGDFEDSSSVSSGVETSAVGSGNVGQGRTEFGLTERLTDILVDEGDGDLLLQQSDRGDTVLQWLQALDLQVMGACRADERLKPLLKMNASNGMAEDLLLAHLSQHFEPSEVGMLARCFCIPLVSTRVGKINKQGTLFCPTAARGNLCLTVLPTSDLRLSFIGDDGNTERLFTVSSRARSPTITVDEISTDSSGRSFHIKVGDDRDFYFWCSEKSKLLGIELLAKMKDMIRRRPSVAELTGISKSRLTCFATHLRAYLMGNSCRESAAYFPASSSNINLDNSDASPSISSKPLRSRYIGNQAIKTNSSYQGSLSPRSSSFKEGPPRSVSSLRNAAREKLRRRGDVHHSAIDNLMIALPHENDASSSNTSGSEKLSSTMSGPLSPSALIESLGNLTLPPTLSAASHVTSFPPLISPYYCWCPQGLSTMQYPSGSSQLTTSSNDCPLLPPLSSLLSGSMTSNLLTPLPSLSLANAPSLEFPAFLPDPLVRFPISGSQQIPTFTPLICDPIVHIPVIDICSSGQGYLVSAGPAITSTIPPLHPKLVNPLIPNTDSVVEKGARETLRLLLSGSSQANPQLIGVFPAVLTNSEDRQGMHATGSRGLYTGSSDVNAIVSSMATIGLVSLARSSTRDADAKVIENSGGVEENLKNFDGSDGSCSFYKDTFFRNMEEGSN
ncbi:uncharacterized protein [Euphorbia lathyris]|uniref:uncharacterized protein n=1 Tax=Euphorbia lathyris TaxID=212925 RepID=UPI0033138B67